MEGLRDKMGGMRRQWGSVGSWEARWQEEGGGRPEAGDEMGREARRSGNDMIWEAGGRRD